MPDKLRITETDYAAHCEAYDGYCMACGEWTYGGCEPDAREYHCKDCEQLKVYGAEELVIMGVVEFIEEE